MAIQSNEKLKFTVIDDSCDYRINRMAYSLPGAMDEYVVEFTPIDDQ
jgi:hypothetical protein